LISISAPLRMCCRCINDTPFSLTFAIAFVFPESSIPVSPKLSRRRRFYRRRLWSWLPFYLVAPCVPATTTFSEQWVGNKNEIPNPATKDDREQSNTGNYSDPEV
jgi:hypothetical protein